MRMNAYDERYLNYAMNCIGEAMDYAYYALNMSVDSFATSFISSGIAEQFEKGNVKYICGMSGAELAIEAVNRHASAKTQAQPPRCCFSFSPEFWTGWILAYYQWLTNYTFNNIIESIPASEICSLYNPYHEASEDKAAEIISARINNSRPISKLQRARKNIHMSQSELAKGSGVNLRTLQQYEIKAKSINNAAAETVLNLCTILHCGIEDILE